MYRNFLVVAINVHLFIIIIYLNYLTLLAPCYRFVRIRFGILIQIHSRNVYFGSRLDPDPAKSYGSAIIIKSQSATELTQWRTVRFSHQPTQILHEKYPNIISIIDFKLFEMRTSVQKI